MSIVWDRDTYERAYSYPYKGEKITYGKIWASLAESGRFYLNRLSLIEKLKPNFNRNDDVLVVGCGFGYMIEAILDLGATRVWGTDISPYIQAEKVNESRADVAPRILDIDVTAADVADQFKAAGAGNNKGKFDHILTEFTIESFNPIANLAAFTAFLDGLDALRQSGQTNVIHLFAGLLEDRPTAHDTTLGMTWLSLETWAAIRPEHVWIDIHRKEDGGGV